MSLFYSQARRYIINNKGYKMNISVCKYNFILGVHVFLRKDIIALLVELTSRTLTIIVINGIHFCYLLCNEIQENI